MIRYYSLDKAIPELNNHTLREVFEDGNLFGHQDWQQDYTNLYNFKTGNYSHQGNHLLLSNVDTNVGYTHTTNAYTPNDKLYFRVKSESNYSQSVNNGTRIVYRTSGGTFITAVNPNINLTGLQENSIITINSTAVWIELRHLIFSQPSDIQYKVYENYAINLTALGIDTLTQDQMDYWFNIYQHSKGVVSNTLQQHAGIDTVVYEDLTLNDIFGRDYNDVVKNATSWGLGATLSTTQSFFQQYADLGLGYVIPALATDIPTTLKLKIGNTYFIAISSNYMSSVDQENVFAISGSGRLYIRVNKTTYPNSAAFEAYLQANDVEFIYERDAVAYDTTPTADMYDYLLNLYQTYKSGIRYQAGDGKNLLDGGVQPLRIDGTTPNANDITFNPIEVVKDTAYTISFDKIGTTRRVRIAFYNNGTNVTSVGKHTIISSVNSSSDTTYGGVMFLEININSYSSVTLSFTGDFDEIKVNTIDTLGTLNSQLEQRTFATNYEPYIKPKSWIATAFTQHAGKDTKLIDAKLDYLNGYSIREVFEEQNLISNDFENDWASNYGTSYGVTDDIYSGLPDAVNQALYKSNTHTVGNKCYTGAVIKTTSTGLALRNYDITADPYDTHSGSGNYEILSVYGVIDADGSNDIQIRQLTTDYQVVYVKEVIDLDLTALGIDHLTQAELDQMFQLYQDRQKNLLNYANWNEVASAYSSLVTVSDNYVNIAAVGPTVYTRRQYQLEPNTTYKLSYTQTVNSGSGNIVVALNNSSNFNTWSNNTLKTTNADGLLEIIFLTYFSTVNVTFSNIQLELGSSATAYTAYGGFSLADVFETNNLIINGDFSNGTTGWTLNGSGTTVIDGRGYIENTVGNNAYFLQSIFNTNDIYYVRADHEVIQNRIWYATTGTTNYDSTSPTYHSYKGTPSQNYFVVGRYDSGLVNKAFVDNIYALNLTTLNIADLTKAFMDDLYEAYNIYQSPAFIDRYGALNAPAFIQHNGIDTAFNDLNGLTLREVFEDGNLVVLDDFYPQNATEDESGTNESIITTNAVGSFVYYRNTYTTNANDVYYLRGDVKVDWASTRIEIPSAAEGYDVGVSNPQTNTYYTLSDKYTSVGYTFIQFIFRGTTSIGDKSYIKDVYFLNLTTLGINLTKEQMDWYFQLYKTYKGGM